jgi:cellulose synthase/poly-beta-1,6-N-acetylglucosamine synthase-like glycosyltransferase
MSTASPFTSVASVASVAHAALASIARLAVLASFLVAAYLSFLTLMACFGSRRHQVSGAARRRFAVLVPAHDEEGLIGRLLESLSGLEYPADLVDVYVVADNCADRTAERARAAGAHVFERTDLVAQGKGHALRWLLERIAEVGVAYDAFVVVDADSVVAANFLRSMDNHLQSGSEVVQAYYTVLNAGDSSVAALRSASLAALHYVRPLGRAALGLSCGLKGNGMCFAAPVVERFGWQWFTLAEDVEFHLALVQAGLRVDFAPETTVWADMPVTLAQAKSQNARWERGRLSMLLRHQVPGLVAAGLRRRSLVRLDAAVEQCIPPLSVPVVLAGAGLVGGAALGLPVLSGLAALSLAAQVAHLVTGLVLVRAPLSTYRALAFAPVYILWKVWLFGASLGALVLPGQKAGRWVRTARTSATGAA